MFRLGGISNLNPGPRVSRVTGKEGGSQTQPQGISSKTALEIENDGFLLVGWLVGCLVVVSCERLHNLVFKEIYVFFKITLLTLPGN